MTTMMLAAAVTAYATSDSELENLSKPKAISDFYTVTADGKIEVNPIEAMKHACRGDRCTVFGIKQKKSGQWSFSVSLGAGSGNNNNFNGVGGLGDNNPVVVVAGQGNQQFGNNEDYDFAGINISYSGAVTCTSEVIVSAQEYLIRDAYLKGLVDDDGKPLEELSEAQKIERRYQIGLLKALNQQVNCD